MRHEANDSGTIEDREQGRGASQRGIPGRGSSRSVSLAETEALLLAFLGVLQPEQLAGSQIVGRLYCTVKALWKLSWFLTDFGYDADLLDRDELDEKALVGLRGVLRVSYTNTLNGNRLLNIEAFAPADRWNGLTASDQSHPALDREVA